MYMKRTLIIGLFVLTIGCKRAPSSSGTATIQPSCNYSAIQTYSGSITQGTAATTITVQADILGKDRVNVYICRQSNCAPIPSTSCAGLSLAQLTNTPCYTTTPSTNIVWDSHLVKIQGAGLAESSTTTQHLLGIKDIPAYSNYLVSEQFCL